MAKKTCNCNNGFIYENDSSGNRIAVDCPKCLADRLEREARNLSLKAGIPEIYSEYSFDSYAGEESSKEVEMLKKYVNEIDNITFKGINIFITGIKSAQKTTMMCVAGKELLKKGYTVKFIFARDIVNVFVKLSGFKQKELEDFESTLEELRTCDFLLIDDIFNVGTSSYWSGNKDIIIAEWNSLFRWRAEKNLRTILTSGKNIQYVEDDVNAEIGALFKRCYKELTFRDSLEKILMKKIDKIFEV
jgi:chromosomal replication initiation ATPase DnaA